MKRVQKYDVLMHLIDHKEPLTMPEAYRLYHTPVLKTVISDLHKRYGIGFVKTEKTVKTVYGNTRVMTYSLDEENRQKAIDLLVKMGYME